MIAYLGCNAGAKSAKIVAIASTSRAGRLDFEIATPRARHGYDIFAVLDFIWSMIAFLGYVTATAKSAKIRAIAATPRARRANFETRTSRARVRVNIFRYHQITERMFTFLSYVTSTSSARSRRHPAANTASAYLRRRPRRRHKSAEIAAIATPTRVQHDATETQTPPAHDRTATSAPRPDFAPRLPAANPPESPPSRRELARNVANSVPDHSPRAIPPLFRAAATFQPDITSRRRRNLRARIRRQPRHRTADARGTRRTRARDSSRTASRRYRRRPALAPPRHRARTVAATAISTATAAGNAGRGDVSPSRATGRPAAAPARTSWCPGCSAGV